MANIHRGALGVSPRSEPPPTIESKSASNYKKLTKLSFKLFEGHNRFRGNRKSSSEKIAAYYFIIK